MAPGETWRAGGGMRGTRRTVGRQSAGVMRGSRPEIVAGMLLAAVLFGAAAGAVPGASLATSPAASPRMSTAPRLGPETHAASDPAPVPAPTIEGSPLVYAAGRIGLDLETFTLPRAYESDYRTACRFPIIEAVARRPLYLKCWTERNAAALRATHQALGLGVVGPAVMLLRGTALELAPPGPESAGPPARAGAGARGPLNASGEEAEGALREALGKAPFTADYQAALLDLYHAYLRAREHAARGCAGLSAEDRAALDANPAAYLLPDGATMPALTGSVETHFAFIERARRVRFEWIFRATEILTDGVRDYLAQVAGRPPEGFLRDASYRGEPFTFHHAAGTLVVGGIGDDTHRETVDLLIDLGGNDRYLNNAGGCGRVGQGAALCIDHRGNDEYAAAGQRFVQGCGFLGVGLLIDLEGDDHYQAEHFAQGVGLLGVGALWDRVGRDRYEAHGACQGAALFGLGMLLDDEGDDTYDCATLGQGAATTLGLGVLSDLAGNDRYGLATAADRDAFGRLPGYGQGGALSFRPYPWRGKLTAFGGVGMLLEGSGNDRYRSQGWCDQGGSYILSLGALVDFAGDDEYQGQTAQGSGIHITNAILIDYAGDDAYAGSFRSGGSGGDRSPGFLLDYAGDDRYQSRTSSYGTACKPFALSLFVDRSGDDTYLCPEPAGRITFNNWDSFGGVWPEAAPQHWPYALALDLGGTDDYQVRHRANNSERHSFGHGLHLDIEWEGTDPIGEVLCPLEPHTEIRLPRKVLASPYADYLQDLQNPDTFERFQAIGRITRADPEVIEMLVAALREPGPAAFHRDLLECLHTFLAHDQVGVTEAEWIRLLLSAPDPEVRLLAAGDCGIWRLADAEDALAAAVGEDPSAGVRRFALAALLTLESRRGAVLARRLAVEDPDEDVRRIAVRYLSRVAAGWDPLPTIAQALRADASVEVRVAAAAAIGRFGDARGVGLLREAAREQDVYLRRAVGRGLAELGEREGIDLLIESLAFPSIDTFHNYDRNIPNDLAALTGQDFAEEERYRPEVWRAWFDEHGEGLDLAAQAAAHRALTALQESLEAAPAAVRIARYEAFLESYPGYRRAATLLAGILNAEAWTRVTAGEGSPDHDPETGLRYALRAVALDPRRNYLDTLAEAHLANGDLTRAAEICQAALAEHPGERMFLERLERIGARRAANGGAAPAGAGRER